eukprot:2581176-Rhodomonas_salina.1
MMMVGCPTTRDSLRLAEGFRRRAASSPPMAEPAEEEGLWQHTDSEVAKQHVEEGVVRPDGPEDR